MSLQHTSPVQEIPASSQPAQAHKNKKIKVLLISYDLSHLHCPLNVLLPVAMPTQFPISLFKFLPPPFFPFFFFCVFGRVTIHNQLASQLNPVTGKVKDMACSVV